VDDIPAVTAQQLFGRLVYHHRQFKRDRAAFGKVDEFKKLPVLGPVVDFTLIGQVLALVVPGRDGAEGRSGRGRERIFPEFQGHRLAGG